MLITGTAQSHDGLMPHLLGHTVGFHKDSSANGHQDVLEGLGTAIEQHDSYCVMTGH